MKKLTDIELLDLFKKNRNKALEEIYDRYAGLVYGVCLKYLGTKEKGMDAVVEVFELLIRKIANQKITNFSSWLYSVTKNYCLMNLRKEKNELKHINDFYLETKKARLDENKVIIPEYVNIQEALCLLSYEQKECVTMFYYNDMSYNEISDATGFSVKSVKSYLQNGRIKLKKIMEEQKNA